MKQLPEMIFSERDFGQTLRVPIEVDLYFKTNKRPEEEFAMLVQDYELVTVIRDLWSEKILAYAYKKKDNLNV